MQIVSPVFAGRAAELAALSEAFAGVGDGTPAAVLVGGEAGGGKTRLVGEFTARIADEALVLTGGCVELGSAGLPYAPFTAVLRRLVRRLGVDEVAALVPGGSGRELARLLPEFGDPPEAGDADIAQARLFEQLLGVFENLAGKQPLVLVVEDAHWADRSTRDLLAFLIRNLRDAAVMLIVTYRTDDLHRDHPLRPVLAELDRVPWVTRLELRRLTKSEVAEQLSGILGQAPASALADRAYERAGGIPLFVEAMVDGDGRVVEEIPESLRDLLLAGVRRLPEETQRVLLAASTSSSGVSHGLLGAVTGLDDTALAETLRPAVMANVLVADADGYAYRHALIGEAVHEEFLPGEHAQTHRRFAEALEKDPSLARRGAAELALHWHCAHDQPRALAAAWDAAAESARVYAHPERLAMLERVLEHWDQVPDAAERIGGDRLDVLEHAAASANSAGEANRGLRFVDTALAEIDHEADPERAAGLLVLRARLTNLAGRPHGLDDTHTAVRLAAEPTSVRAQALSRLGLELALRGRGHEALPVVAEALELAQRLGDRQVAAEAHNTLAFTRLDVGDIDGAREAFEESRERAERLGTGWLLPRALVNIADFWTCLGEYERAAEVAQEAYGHAVRAGVPRTQGVFAATNHAEALIPLGRWDAAMDALGLVTELPASNGFITMVKRLRAEIGLARGDTDVVDELAGEMVGYLEGGRLFPQEALPVSELLIHYHLRGGDADKALAVAEEALWGRRQPDGPRFVWPLLVAGMRACAARDDGAPELRGRLAELAADLAVFTPVDRAHRLMFVAETDRAPGSFDAAAAAWHELKVPYSEAYALFRAAEALAATGDRDAATERLARAAALAGQLGAAPLSGEIEDLARRARISLPGVRTDAPLGLTPREFEVLRLVAGGRSNRDIAAELFISTKTASVHVSNILAKLGAAGRGEAAAIAHRLHLFD